MLVVGMILSLGVPNFSELTQNSRISGTTSDLHSSFQLARSEATRSRSNITICASANALSADAECDGTFDDGWIIFVDLNGDLVRTGAGENVLQAHPAIPDSINIVTNGGAGYFGFVPSGLGRSDIDGQPAVQTARICDGRGNVATAGGSSAARLLVVTPGGRATVLHDVARIAGAGGCQ